MIGQLLENESSLNITNLSQIKDHLLERISHTWLPVSKNAV